MSTEALDDVFYPHETKTLIVPQFLLKLGKLVDDPETDDLICWNDSGESFIITDTIQFTKEILPNYFKHNNLASFIRQLNMYGFHKIVSTDSGSLRNSRNQMEFAHTCFLRDHPYLMTSIKRKIPSQAKATALSVTNFPREKDLSLSEKLTQILADVSDLKGKQIGYDRKLASAKRENETLWREVAILRQKHLQQERIINRLIQFIVTMVRPTSRNTHVPVRRRYQLMLDGAQEETKKKSTGKGPSIRELNPLEQLIAKNKPAKVGRKRQSFQNSRNITNAMDTQNEFEESKSGEYVVMSPDDVGPAPSPWLHFDESDGDDAAMTPINPYEITPVPVEIILPTKFQQKKKSNATTFKTGSSAEPKLSAGSSKVTIAPSMRSKSSGKEFNKVDSITKPADKKFHVPLSAPKLKRMKNQNSPCSTNAKRRKNELANNSEEFSNLEETHLGDQLQKNDLHFINEEGENIDVADDSSNQRDKMIASAEFDPKTLTEGTFGQEMNNLTIARPGNSSYSDSVARDLSNHVDQMQGDIDILKEILGGDNYNLDANTILELFEDPLHNLMPPSADSRENKQDSEGHELMTYGGMSMADFADLFAGTPETDGSTFSPPVSPAPSCLVTPVLTPLGDPERDFWAQRDDH